MDTSKLKMVVAGSVLALAAAGVGFSAPADAVPAVSAGSRGAVPAAAELPIAAAVAEAEAAGVAAASAGEGERAVATGSGRGAPAILDVQTGSASYYANALAGRRTASGSRYDPGALTAAHRKLPFGTRARVTNVANGRSVEVRITDRGPFAKGRVLDLSRRAAEALDFVRKGHTRVRIEVLEYGAS